MKYWSDHEQCFIFDRRAAYFKSDFTDFYGAKRKWTVILYLLQKPTISDDSLLGIKKISQSQSFAFIKLDIRFSEPRPVLK